MPLVNTALMSLQLFLDTLMSLFRRGNADEIRAHLNLTASKYENAKRQLKQCLIYRKVSAGSIYSTIISTKCCATFYNLAYVHYIFDFYETNHELQIVGFQKWAVLRVLIVNFL